MPASQNAHASILSTTVKTRHIVHILACLPAKEAKVKAMTWLLMANHERKHVAARNMKVFGAVQGTWFPEYGTGKKAQRSLKRRAKL